MKVLLVELAEIFIKKGKQVDFINRIRGFNSSGTQRILNNRYGGNTTRMFGRYFVRSDPIKIHLGSSLSENYDRGHPYDYLFKSEQEIRDFCRTFESLKAPRLTVKDIMDVF